MQFLPFFSLSACKNGDILSETRGFFAERWVIFPAASHFSPLSCVWRAQSTRRCRVCSLAAQSACPTRPCPSRAMAVDWVQRQKNRPSPTFSCGKV